MSNPSPYRALFTPVSMIGVACEQILAHADVDPSIKAQAEQCFRYADEAGEVVSKKISQSAVQKMFQHGDEFRMECRRKGLVNKGQNDTAGVVIARVMAGNLCVDHYTHRQKIRKYPLWRDLLQTSSTLLEMILAGAEELEADAYKVAEYMVAVVAPTDKRASKKKVRESA